MADPVVEQRVSALSDVSVSDIAQRYKMQEELGSGAQATVYRATHKKTNAKVRRAPCARQPFVCERAPLRRSL